MRASHRRDRIAGTLLLAGALVFGIYNQGGYLSLLALLMPGAACFIPVRLQRATDLLPLAPLPKALRAMVQ